jgi:cell shape-determining protein MreC
VSRSRRTRSRAWALPVLVLVLIVGLTAYFRAPASNLFWRVAAPAVRLRDALGASEAARLRAELASTTAALADHNALLSENRELKAQLGRTNATRRIAAVVLSRPPGTPYDTLLIDAGTKQGVAAGDLVSAGGESVVGRVSEAYDDTARVELLSAPGSSYQALLRGSITLAVEGQGGGSLRAEVPAGTTVAVGDSVTFPGLFGGFVATVSATDAGAGESFIVVYMHLPINPADLRFVDVLKP